MFDSFREDCPSLCKDINTSGTWSFMFKILAITTTTIRRLFCFKSLFNPELCFKIHEPKSQECRLQFRLLNLISERHLSAIKPSPRKAAVKYYQAGLWFKRRRDKKTNYETPVWWFENDFSCVINKANLYMFYFYKPVNWGWEMGYLSHQ